MNRWSIRRVLVLSLLGIAATASGEERNLNRVMRDKLQHVQKMLEAVVTSNWVVLESETQTLEALTNNPAWNVLKEPEYARQSLAFRGAIEDLRRAAKQRDLEKTPQAYNALTLRCVDCHRYVARARMVKRD